MVAKKTAGSTPEKAVDKAAAKASSAGGAAPARKAAGAVRKADGATAKTAGKAPVKTAVKAAAGKTAAGRTAAAKTTAKTAAVKPPAKGAAKTTGAKTTTVRTTTVKTGAVKSAAGKNTAGRNTARKPAAVAKKTAEKTAEKTVKKTPTTAGKATAAPAAAEAAAQAAQQTGARKVVARKSTGTARKTAGAATSGLPKARATTAPAAPGELAVRPGEDPWTPEEVAEARTELETEAERLRDELLASEEAITGLMRDSGDGAGDDQADTGTKNITRESEMALAANAREMLEQTERALERLDAGTYGLCESCGRPIGKARMQAFPRATLCVDCKQKQERRH
ncbi:TraR/DksA family transcriptional regulator [Streptomyces sp. NPDC059851]|uniref:TraR/DksA family transcriptional regulator n=1 Tax=Streptomyces sp. NPDC059851 TaxID=3346971 RepID=UPI00364BD652